MASGTLFKGDEAGSEVYSQSTTKHISGLSYNAPKFAIRIREDHSEGTLLFGRILERSLGPDQAFNNPTVVVW